MDHALPRMDLDGTTRAFEALAVAKRVIEEYFIFTYVILAGGNLARSLYRGDACGSRGSARQDRVSPRKQVTPWSRAGPPQHAFPYSRRRVPSRSRATSLPHRQDATRSRLVLWRQ